MSIWRKTIFLTAAAACALAQAPGEPFAMIRILRHPARAAAQNLIQPYADGRTEVNVLGLTSISGPPEAWLIEGHDSLASLEAVDSALSLAGSRGDAPLDYLPLSATAIAVYRPGLSHRSEEAIRLMPIGRRSPIRLLPEGHRERMCFCLRWPR